MSRDSIQEPSVVRDDDGTSREVFQAFFQSTQRIHVDVVGRFVEEKHVSFLFQRKGEVHSVTFAARQYACFLLLVVAAEIESRDVSSRVHGAFAKLYQFVATRDDFPHGLLRVDVGVLLIYVTCLHCLAYLKLA